MRISIIYVLYTIRELLHASEEKNLIHSLFDFIKNNNMIIKYNKMVIIYLIKKKLFHLVIFYIKNQNYTNVSLQNKIKSCNN
jgi:hypothetical protein